MASGKVVIGGAAFGALAWLAGTGVAAAAGSKPVPASPSATAAAVSNECPIPGNYGDGSTTSAYQAYAAISPTTPPSSSGQLAFTGGNFTKEFAAGGLLIGAGAALVIRARRRPLLMAEAETGDGSPNP